MKERQVEQAESILDWAREGKDREQKKWAEHWRGLELQLTVEQRTKILKAVIDLEKKVQRGKLIERRAREYWHLLIKMGAWTQNQLDNVPVVTRLLKERFSTPSNLKSAVTAYNYYRNANNIKEPVDLYIDRRRKLPILTPETTLKATISSARRPWWQAYFAILYECGPRPTEPFLMLKQDINFQRELVRLGTGKGSGETLERELPISPRTTELLRKITAGKAPTDYVFTKPFSGKPQDYNSAWKALDAIRKQLKSAGYNTQGLDLYVFRHHFATRLYHATNDLARVSRALGHRDPKSVMFYLHLQFDEPRRYDVVNCPVGDKETINQKIAEGWELALQTPDTIYFRRPRWIP